MCYQEFQVRRIYHSKNVLDFHYDIYCQKRIANRQSWPPSGQKGNINIVEIQIETLIQNMCSMDHKALWSLMDNPESSMDCATKPYISCFILVVSEYLKF